MRVERLPENPIISPHMDRRMGDNINGPSLIRVPEWVEHPLGRYYLYFGHHAGSYIRLAYADDLRGPWTIHEPGVLDLADSHFEHHIASPDVHVYPAAGEQTIRMYFHGRLPAGSSAGDGGQGTRVAISRDGLHFRVLPEVLGAPYFRVLQWDGQHYAIGMPGILYRSHDGLTGFERGPNPFEGIAPGMRHTALRRRGSMLDVFYTNRGDAPEQVLRTEIDLSLDWTEWRPTTPTLILRPEREYEGADLPLVSSQGGRIDEPVNQLRDPCIFLEDGRTYLLYSVAGEHGIAIAELLD